MLAKSKYVFKLVKNNEFAKNTLTVMTGAVIAQAIPIAIIPLLTRIFTPEDFGLVAIYGAFVSVLGVIATGRYELAIMQPKEDADAKVLLQISTLVALLISLTISAPLIFWNDEIAHFLGNKDIAKWLLLVPASVLLTGICQSLIQWNNRQKKFKHTASSRINQSLSQGVAQISFGHLKTSGGLILGQFIGICFSTVYLLFINSSYKNIFTKNKRNKIIKLLTEYKDFPKYGMAGGLCDATAVQMPVLLLTKFYSSTFTGMFSLTFRVLNIPSSIISSALTQVLFQKIVEISHNNPTELKKYISRISIILFLIYSPIIPALLFFGDSLFGLIFGDKWRNAGFYSGYLAIAVAIRFAVSPLSAVLSLERNIKAGVAWQILYLCTISTTLLICTSLSFESFLIAFVTHELILYSIYMALIFNCAKSINSDKAHMPQKKT